MYGAEFLETVVEHTKPTVIETTYYLFWEKGIGYEEFKKLPIPYIFSVMKTLNYIKREEEKIYNKQRVN